MAGILYVFASDTGDLPTATEVLKVREVAGELEISGHIGLGSGVLLMPPAAFATKLRSGLADVVTDVSSGWQVDIEDDPALATDPKRLHYQEATTTDPAFFQIFDGSSNSLIIKPETATDLEAALVLLGH